MRKLPKKTRSVGTGEKFIKPSLKGNSVVFLELAFLILLLILHAASAGHYADFFPIDGTFQDYNPVRRLLDGQVPYRDFQDYLGLGHLYAGAFFTALFGGSYRESLMAFSFLALACLALISIAMAYVILGTMKRALGMTCFALLLILTKTLPFINDMVLYGDILSAINGSLGSGNSARFVRGMALPLSMILLEIYISHARSYGRLSSGNILKKNFANPCIMPICMGMIAGFCFPWSNDYGISCFACILVMTFFLSLFWKRKLFYAVKSTCIELAASVGAILFFVLIFTRGHFYEWLSYTFGTGGYQAWYFYSSKSFFIFDVDFSFLMLLQAFAIIAYLFLLWTKKASWEAIIRYGIPCYANMTCFCAANEYKLLSGEKLHDVAYTVLFFTIFYEGIAWICRLVSRSLLTILKQGFLFIICIGCPAWIISTAKDEFIFRYVTEKEGHLIEALGGNMTSLYEDVLAANEFLKGEEFFSTYSSAQEVVDGKFQPSGTDYIIHALGDAKREEYLSVFRDADFRYVATIQKSFTPWEYFFERANWFFYRELYRDYHPVFSNTYELYWERTEEDGTYTVTDPIELSVNRLDDARLIISVKTDKNVNGFADVFIDYDVEKKPDSLLAKFAFQTMLRVANSGIQLDASEPDREMNYLREKSAEYVPISITDGYGEITLTALPSKCVTLKLNDAKCDSIYTSYYTMP